MCNLHRFVEFVSGENIALTAFATVVAFAVMALAIFG